MIVVEVVVQVEAVEEAVDSGALRGQQTTMLYVIVAATEEIRPVGGWQNIGCDCIMDGDCLWSQCGESYVIW